MRLGFGLGLDFANTVTTCFQFRSLFLCLVQFGSQTTDHCHRLVCTFHWSTSHFMLLYFIKIIRKKFEFYKTKKLQAKRSRKCLTHFRKYFCFHLVSLEILFRSSFTKRSKFTDLFQLLHPFRSSPPSPFTTCTCTSSSSSSLQIRSPIRITVMYPICFCELLAHIAPRMSINYLYRHFIKQYKTI